MAAVWWRVLRVRGAHERAAAAPPRGTATRSPDPPLRPTSSQRFFASKPGVPTYYKKDSDKFVFYGVISLMGLTTIIFGQGEEAGCAPFLCASKACACICTRHWEGCAVMCLAARSAHLLTPRDPTHTLLRSRQRHLVHEEQA